MSTALRILFIPSFFASLFLFLSWEREKTVAWEYSIDFKGIEGKLSYRGRRPLQVEGSVIITKVRRYSIVCKVSVTLSLGQARAWLQCLTFEISLITFKISSPSPSGGCARQWFRECLHSALKPPGEGRSIQPTDHSNVSDVSWNGHRWIIRWRRCNRSLNHITKEVSTSEVARYSMSKAMIELAAYSFYWHVHRHQPKSKHSSAPAW